jgi:hypothetical protein
MDPGNMDDPPRPEGEPIEPLYPAPLPSVLFLTRRVLAVCEKRGWPLDWPNRSANLFIEAAELTEAVRGKSGDVLGEAADVLFTLLAFAGTKGVTFPEILMALRRKIEWLEKRPMYPGEYTTKRTDR